MARSKSSSRWLKEHFEDPYVKEAQKAGYRSRAVFKLKEIQQKDHIIKPGMTVIDLGAAPGGWAQQAKEWVGGKGRVIALDILPMESLAGVEFIQGDFTEAIILEQLVTLLAGVPVDVVMSDMAPNMSGMSEVDQPRALYLAELALELAQEVLKPNMGIFLVKTFQGVGFDAYLKELRQRFKQVVIRKPKASRARSHEVYLLAKGFKA